MVMCARKVALVGSSARRSTGLVSPSSMEKLPPFQNVTLI